MTGLGLGSSIDIGLTLVALVALETLLSADNAVALAALVQPLPTPQQQQKALNWGLAVALVLRIALLLTATWVVQFWQFQVAGALYLLWLVGKHFWLQLQPDPATPTTSKPSSTFWHIIPLIAFTDLAFSLDSVTTAVAVTDRLWLVLTGCLIGVMTLRFLAGLFVRWLEEFVYLQDAAYLTIFSVGLKLLGKAIQPELVPPDWTVLAMVAILFTWGFSKRSAELVSEEATSTVPEQVHLD